MEAKYSSKFSGERDWIDETSGAYVRMVGLQVSAYQDCAVSLSMFASDRHVWPDVLGRFAHGKLNLTEVGEQNKRAERYLSQLKTRISFDHIWEMLSYDSNGSNIHFALRFPVLVDEVIGQLGGGVRVVYDNSKVRRGTEKIEGFTTKLMEWRMKSGDLSKREVHYFPAKKQGERNMWIYVVE
ncbi:MAG: hypothetical protein ACOYT9_03820 [Patescibacteria group bacterium]